MSNKRRVGDLDINSLNIDSILNDVSQGIAGDDSVPEQQQEIQLTTPTSGGRRSTQEFDKKTLLNSILPGFKDEMPQGYDLPTQEPESFLGTIGRNVAGAGQSIASVLGGLPGSIAVGGAKLLGNIAGKAHKYATTPPAGMTREEWGRSTSQPVVDPEKLWDPITGLGLTVGGIKKHIAGAGETVFGIDPKFWDPKTATEKTGREYVERVTGLLHPGLWPISLGKAMLAPIIGFGGKKGAKALGLGDFWQEVVGGVGETAFLGWDTKKFRDRMGAAYDKARNVLNDPKTIVTAVNIKPISNLVFNPKKFVENMNDPTKAEQWIIDRSNGIANSLKSQKIEVDKLWNMKKSFGKHASEFKGRFKDISRFAKKTNDTFEEMIQGYGKKYNPKFLKAYNEANNAFKGFQKMPKYISSINRVLEKRSDLISVGIAAGAVSFGTLGKGLVLLKLAKNTLEANSLLRNSAAVRNYYLKGIAAASKQNIKSATRYFEKADEALEKKFPGITEKIMEIKNI